MDLIAYARSVFLVGCTQWNAGKCCLGENTTLLLLSCSWYHAPVQRSLTLHAHVLFAQVMLALNSNLFQPVSKGEFDLVVSNSQFLCCF